MESIYIKDEPDDLDDSFDSSDTSSSEDNSTNIDVKHEPFEETLFSSGFLKREIDRSSEEFREFPSLNGNDTTTECNRTPSNLIAFIIPASTTTSTTALASSVDTQSPSLPLQKQPVLGLPSILRKPVKNDEALSEFLKQVDQLEQQQQEEIAKNIVPVPKDPKVFRKGERYCCGFCTFSSVFEHMFEKHLKYRHRFLSQLEYRQALESQREKNRKQSWAPAHGDLDESSEESQSDSGRNKTNMTDDPLDLKKIKSDLSIDLTDQKMNINWSNDLPDPKRSNTNSVNELTDPERNNINALEDEAGQKNNNLFHASCESGKCLSTVEERKLLDWMHSCRDRGQLLTEMSVSASAKFIVYTSTKKAKRKHAESDFHEHICVSSKWLKKFFEKPVCLQFNWSPSATVYDLTEDMSDTKVLSGEPTPDGFVQERPGRRKARRQSTLPDPSATAPSSIGAGKAIGSSEAIISKWFVELKKFMHKQGFDSDKFLRPDNGGRVYMADIIGLFLAKESDSASPLTASSRVKPILCKKKCANVMPEPYASGKEISVMCCMNALGAFPQPYLVFSRECGRNQLDFRTLKTNSFRRALSPDGSFREEIFLTWLHFFDLWLKEHKIPKPVLLILDGTFTRVDFRASTFASAQKIMLYFTPPNSYNYLNPLCVGVFPKLIAEFKKSLAAWESEGNQSNQDCLSKHFPNLFMDAWARVASPGAAVLGFSQSALVAYDYNSLKQLGEEFE